MKLDAPLIVGSLVLTLGTTACDSSAPLPDEELLDEELLAAETDESNESPVRNLADVYQDDDEPMDPETTDAPTGPAAGDADGFMQEIDPSQIIDGFTLDSDRDVMVNNNGGTCSGTLLRNNVVLTARHCVTTDGTINGPIAAANAFTVTQDGPGATLGSSLSVTAVAAMAGQDVAMLRLSGVFSIDGQPLGQSTQILATPQADVVGNNVLCQGYGRNSCGGGTGTLRAGLVSVADDDAGMLEYAPINGYDWIQYKGDSGSSCRLGVFVPGNLNKALGVLSTAGCGWIATETGPQLYRGWAIDQMNAWAGGDFNDDFSAWGFYTIDEPAGMLQGPSDWHRIGGVLTEDSNAYTNTTYHEGTRYVSTTQVASDATVRVTVESPDNDAAGLVLRYRDSTHYYRLSFDEQRRYARIIRRSGNGWVVIAEDLDFDIDWSTAPEIAFYASGTVLAGFVDGQVAIVGVDDDANAGYTAGRAGMYTWGLTDATFDDFEIDRF